MSFWVYILRCSDASYYTGHTDNLEQRIGQHTSGAITTCYTYTRRPLQLVYSQDFTTREEALTAEQQIKGWSRKKKEAMMRGDWAEVSRLAKSHSTPAQNPVRAEPVVRQAHQDRKEENTVRAELVEAQAPSIHPSTSSGRTDGGEA